QVPKDLETICLKCLQKAPPNRYASAQELADELSRFLAGEPIHARPIPQIARFWRLCKRNPITSSAIALAVVILIAATGVSTAFYFRESVARRESEISLLDAQDVLDKFVTKVSEGTLLNEPGKQKQREELLHEALSVTQKFLKDRGNDPRVQDQLGKAY